MNNQNIMATLTPQQQSLLNQISQQAQQIQSQLNTLAAAQKAGMTITPQTSVQQAASYISSGQPSTSSSGTSQTMSALTSSGTQPSYQNYTIQKGDTLSALANKYGTTVQALLSANPQITNPNLIYAGSALKIPTITTSPQTQTTQTPNPQIPPQNPQNPLQIPPQSQDWQTAYKQLLDQYQALTQKYANPPAPDTSNISNIYSKAASDLTAKYQKVLADLQKKQQEDRQRLVGRYAAAGFSEPGILGGSPAGIPGVATKGLNELESQQASDITNLQQAQAGDLNALAAAQASAVQQAQQQAIDNYYKQLQLMQSVLGNQANLLTYQTPQQQLLNDLQKEQLYKQLGLGSYAKMETPKTEIVGNEKSGYTKITYDDQGRIISKEQVIPPIAGGTTSDTIGGNTSNTSGSGFFANIAINQAKDLLSQISDKTVGPKSIIPRMSGVFGAQTDAYYFYDQLKTLENTLAFSVLSALKELSKTGGALGQVSNYEEAMLKSALGALDPNLPPDRFKTQLNKVLNVLYGIQAAHSTGIVNVKITTPDGQKSSVGPISIQDLVDAIQQGYKIEYL